MDERFRQQGAFSWCELLTTDVNAAREFYTGLFGWTAEDMSMTGETYIVVKSGGDAVGGIMTIPEQAKGMPPGWTAYVTVDDVDSTARKAEELGGKLLVGPTDIPKVGRFCVIQDPQGAVINAITYRPM